MKFNQSRAAVLSWYDKHGRDLPWRYKAGATPDPYRVWLSEIMLQQTTVTAVKPYFERFVDEWPSVHDLAAAPREDIMNAWAGLGYYSRARNLHACAVVVANAHDGAFPHDQKTLKTLPGIGDYTSAAMRTIAFNKAATVMDGNIERIISRIFTIDTPLPKAKTEIKVAAAPFFDVDDNRHADFAQALMDIGTSICTPKAPKCMLCPLNNMCQAHATGTMVAYPIKAKKKKLPHKYGDAYIIINEDDEILIHHRPDRGLLAGMNGVPTSEWSKERESIEKPTFLEGLDVYERTIHEKVYHVFTHFSLELNVLTLKINKNTQAIDNYRFYLQKEVSDMGFPTVFQKCLNMAFDKQGKTL